MNQMFRAKRIDNNEWVYGSLINMDINKSQVFIVPFFNFASTLSCRDLITMNLIAVNSETVGQSTGQKDKNGKEIFEGDIVKGENYLFPCYDNRKLPVYWDKQKSGFSMDIFNMNEIEVVGNVYDNKKEEPK